MPPRKKTTTVAAETELKKPKVAVGGNTRGDIAWLDSMDGRLFTPDPAGRPEGFLYDIHYQWDGLADELDLSFFDAYGRSPKLELRCTANAYIRDESGMYVIDNDWERLRRPCLAIKGRGTNVCHAHGSKIPAVVAAAKQRLAEASEVVALRLIGLTAVKDEDKVRIRPQDRIAASTAVLDRAGVKGGVELEVSGTGFERVMNDLFGAEVGDGNQD